MDLKVVLLTLLLLARNSLSGARNIAAASEDYLGVDAADKLTNTCTICEQYAAMALHYLKDESTQHQVKVSLHQMCTQLDSFQAQCKTLVDEFAKTLFSQVSAIKPQGICKKFKLCKNVRISSLPTRRYKCDVCRLALTELLDVLKDPDTELDIIERLLRACNLVGDNYINNCKKTVFEFGPVILVNAGTFVEKLDICTTLHACNATHSALHEKRIQMVTSSILIN